MPVNNQDLFEVSSSPSPTSSISSLSASTSSTGSGATNPFANFLSSFGQIDPGFVILAFNRFLLGWTVFYSIYFLLHFWWKRLDNPGELSNEKSGTDALFEALYIWLRYLLFLLLAGIFGLSSNPIFQLVVLPLVFLLGVYKIWADISGATKFAGYFGWAGQTVKNLQKIFRG